METYVCSDLHGQYDLFIKLLKKINFSSTDTLYVLGDIIDKGNKSLALIDYIRKQPNIHCILGNHEHSFLQYLHCLMKTDEDFDEKLILEKLQSYFPCDNYLLTWDIIEYIERLPFYIETDSFIGVHAGLKLDKNNYVYPMKYQSEYFMLYDRNFKNVEIKNPFNKPILFGHTPCNYDNDTGEFIKEPNYNKRDIKDYVKIRLDTGSAFTKMLGALRTSDMEEIYVKGN